MSALPIWNCEAKPGVAPDGAELSELTVGAKFHLQCSGDIAVNWSQDPVVAVFGKNEEKYSIHILQADRLAPNAVDFTVTSYRAGDHKPEYVRFVQGENGFEWLKPTWTVRSVLKQGEEPKPFPSYGPWSLSLPYWIFAALALALAIVGYVVWRKVRKYNQRVALLAELQKHKTALSPIHQYYRDTRGISRRLHNARQMEELATIAQDLERNFKLYFLRRFQIPTLDWSDGQILRDLRHRHRKVYRGSGDDLRKALREIRSLSGQKQILLKDLEQVQRLSLNVIEKADRAAEEVRG
ncbi:MAG: hypothetical protein AB7F86_14600 [Bdellovibrionales bacterium]